MVAAGEVRSSSWTEVRGLGLDPFLGEPEVHTGQ